LECSLACSGISESAKKWSWLWAKLVEGLGLVAFLPSLLIISVAVPDFKSEVLSALLGTVAGYVLSSNRQDEK
jgi:hypothetical protein